MTTPLMVKGIYLMVKAQGHGFVLKDYRYRADRVGIGCPKKGAPWWFNSFSHRDETPKWIGSDTLVEWNDEETC